MSIFILFSSFCQNLPRYPPLSSLPLFPLFALSLFTASPPPGRHGWTVLFVSRQHLDGDRAVPGERKAPRATSAIHRRLPRSGGGGGGGSQRHARPSRQHHRRRRRHCSVAKARVSQAALS